MLLVKLLFLFIGEEEAFAWRVIVYAGKATNKEATTT